MLPLRPSIHLAAVEAARQIELVDARMDSVRSVLTSEPGGIVVISTAARKLHPIRVFGFTTKKA